VAPLSGFLDFMHPAVLRLGPHPTVSGPTLSLCAEYVGDFTAHTNMMITFCSCSKHDAGTFVAFRTDCSNRPVRVCVLKNSKMDGFARKFLLESISNTWHFSILVKIGQNGYIIWRSTHYLGRNSLTNFVCKIHPVGYIALVIGVSAYCCQP